MCGRAGWQKRNHSDLPDIIHNILPNRTLRLWRRVRHAVPHTKRGGDASPLDDICRVHQYRGCFADDTVLIGINSATYCGYTAVHNAGMGGEMAVLGSFIATFALSLPSFILMLVVSKVFMKHKDSATVQYVFMGLRPAVVGLLAAATLMLLTAENFSTPENPWYFYVSIAIFLASFIGTFWVKVNPIKMIAMAAFAGLLLLW